MRATESAGRGQTQCAGRNLPRHVSLVTMTTPPPQIIGVGVTCKMLRGLLDCLVVRKSQPLQALSCTHFSFVVVLYGYLLNIC